MVEDILKYLLQSFPKNEYKQLLIATCVVLLVALVILAVVCYTEREALANDAGLDILE